MPKEHICRTPHDNVITVGWGRDVGSVQIATESPTRLVASTVPRFGEGVEYPPQDDGEATKEGLPFGGWYADLDRDAINRLIRILRKARDAAYGSDA